jgi:hypothetical protein
MPKNVPARSAATSGFQRPSSINRRRSGLPVRRHFAASVRMGRGTVPALRDHSDSGAMETHKVSLKDRVDPLAHELAPSEGTQPYLDYLTKAYRNNAVGLEAATPSRTRLAAGTAIYVESVFRAQVGIRRFRGRVRSARPSPHPRTHAVGDDQGTRICCTASLLLVVTTVDASSISMSPVIRPAPGSFSSCGKHFHMKVHPNFLSMTMTASTDWRLLPQFDAWGLPLCKPRFRARGRTALQSAGLEVVAANWWTTPLRSTGVILDGFYLNTPSATGGGPIAAVIDPAGKFLFVANRSSGNVSVFAIDSKNETLQEVKGSPFKTGKGAAAIAIDITGSYLLVADHEANDIASLQIDSETGALTPLGRTPLLSAGPSSLAVDPSGQYLYVTSDKAGGVTTLKLEVTTGTLLAADRTTGRGKASSIVLAGSAATPVAREKHRTPELHRRRNNF